MTSKKWYAKFPGNAYAEGPIIFEKEVDERYLRVYLRNFYGYSRLPKGFQCWPTI